jgi:hypothetical protein
MTGAGDTPLNIFFIVSVFFLSAAKINPPSVVALNIFFIPFPLAGFGFKKLSRGFPV